MKKTLITILALAFFSFSFSSCFSPIFYEINNDVKPEESTVSGIIRSIARYTVGNQEFLVTVSDQGIRYKPIDTTSDKYSKHGCWLTYSKMPDNYVPHKYDYYGTEDHIGQQSLKIISDSTNLYLITTEYKNAINEGSSSPSRMHIYTTAITDTETDGIKWKESSWTELKIGEELPIFIPEDGDYYFTAFAFFSTNSVQKEHRSAYIRKGGTSIYSSLSESELKTYANPTYYQLDGSNSPKEISVTLFDTEASENDLKYYGGNSAVWFNGDVKFFNSLAAETNETYTTNPDKIYYGVAGSLYYVDASDLSKHENPLTAGSSTITISSLAVSADSLLIGRASYSSSSSSASGGITKTTLTNGVPGNNLVSFTTNAEIKLKSAYFIMTLINEDPSKNELDSNLFASVSFIGTGTSNSASFKNMGLWSYYPTRGNWNCE